MSAAAGRPQDGGRAAEARREAPSPAAGGRLSCGFLVLLLAKHAGTLQTLSAVAHSRERLRLSEGRYCVCSK